MPAHYAACVAEDACQAQAMLPYACGALGMVAVIGQPRKQRRQSFLPTVDTGPAQACNRIIDQRWHRRSCHSLCKLCPVPAKDASARSHPLRALSMEELAMLVCSRPARSPSSPLKQGGRHGASSCSPFSSAHIPDALEPDSTGRGLGHLCRRMPVCFAHGSQTDGGTARFGFTTSSPNASTS